MSNSQASQDLFVLNMTNNKKNGYFLEIGSHDAICINNTYLLEKDYGYKGLLVDYSNQYEYGYKIHRPNSLYKINDARNVDYKNILDNNNFPKNMDYLQIDLDVENKSTLETLYLLNDTIFDTYKFATVTFEHDYYRGDFFDTRNTSRHIFKARGYVLVFPDVCTDDGCVGSGWQSFEDWYVHPDLVDMSFVNSIKTDKSLPHMDIINKINKQKNYKYLLYHGEHFGKNVDELIREYFPDFNYKGIFLDIGAYEPINISNSYHFEMNGWDVHCFEANTNLIDGLKESRKNVYNYAIYNENKDFVEFNVVNGVWGGGSLTAGVSAIELDPHYLNTFGSGIKSIFQVKVPQKTLNNVIETEISYIKEIDVISIDVEGGELNVLKGIDLLKYKPKLLVVENVFNHSNINEYLTQFGYILDKHVAHNQFYKLETFIPK
jgi:FkbM family methyltransferase